MKRNRNAAAVSIAALTIMFFPVPAEAASATVNCHGTEEVAYTPALTSTPRQLGVSMRGTYRCQSSDGDITGVALAIDGGGVFDCGGGRFLGTIVADWDNGQQSTMHGGSTVDVRGDHGTVVSGSGEVTGGLFAGGWIERVVVVDYAGPGCAEAGVESARATTILRVGVPAE